MTPERHEQIGAIFDQALKIAPEHRSAFLEKACGRDSSLRAEVESLLASLHRADDFLITPAVQMAAQSLASGPKSKWIGRRIGDYEIRSLLGAGGMGEVYRAHDPKLKRDVAIKLLPDAFADDQERFARFQREAQILARSSQFSPDQKWIAYQTCFTFPAIAN